MHDIVQLTTQGRQLLGAPQAPILTRCNHIQTQLLRKIDPQLWERMEQEGVEAQIWAMYVQCQP